MSSTPKELADLIIDAIHANSTFAEKLVRSYPCQGFVSVEFVDTVSHDEVTINVFYDVDGVKSKPCDLTHCPTCTVKELIDGE